VASSFSLEASVASDGLGVPESEVVDMKEAGGQTDPLEDPVSIVGCLEMMQSKVRSAGVGIPAASSDERNTN
jgi:hypothetical protein